ncbi:MAG TPA: hypothetical protein VFS10_19600, partial [Pyrinomonadaceae bacterium]|nr:hypothetical protein [Pyrinomonadaceae bacterium]
FVKHASRLSRVGAALSALVLLLGLTVWAQAQTISQTPDSFVLQITSTTIPPVPTPTPSPTPTPTATPTPTPVGAPLPRNSFASGISGDGRFVVIESQGDIATNRTPERNNADGNPEIFLFDYAQRRIFQITNTKNALKSATASPVDPTNIDVQVVNVRPHLSHDGRFIVFISNAYVDNAATSPLNFDGNTHAAALKLDGNTEIWLYAVPEAPAADLTSGLEVPATDLAAGTMTRITATPATAVPRAGASGLAPFFARDNDAPAANDDASIIAFTTLARSGLTGVQNTDGNQEVVLFNRTGGTFVQVTNTTDKPSPNNPIPTLVNSNSPSLSGNGQVLAFESNADLNSNEAEADRDNGEIYVANFDGATISNLRPVTRTPPERRTNFIGTPVNILSPGQRLSRDGTRLAFESSALFNADGTLPAANGGLGNTYGIYVYNITANTFAQVMARAPEAEDPDLFRRFPTFTGDSSRVVWISDLNVRPDGTVALDGAADGLNTTRVSQVFTAPVASLGTTNQGISRLTRQPVRFAILQPFPSDTVRRFAFSIAASELGGGNPDGLFEAFYALVPAVTSEVPAPSPTPAASPAPVSFFTGASDRPVAGPSPSPTPPAVAGLAPGMLGIARSTLALAPSEREVDRNNAHETLRRPPLPIELNGVSVSVSSAAAGLYFVSPGQINFVVPPGLIPATTALPVVINNNGAVIRTSLQLLAAQPDIFTSTNGAGGRAAVLNVTNPCVAPSGEPFSVTTTRPVGSATGDCTSAETETVPTRLLILLTGIRAVPANGVFTVRIGTTDLTGGAIVQFGASLTPGFEQVVVELPPSLAGAGDVPLIVTVGTTAGTFTSRPAESAPRITIQ